MFAEIVKSFAVGAAVLLVFIGLVATAQRAPELFGGLVSIAAATVMGFALRRMIHYW